MKDRKHSDNSERLEKNTLNVIRTTMRNNIELTNIADNKANVLLSLNSIMITFLLPSIISNYDFILDKNLVIPITILIVTCLVTIWLAALALKPGKFDKLEKDAESGKIVSPFFFGNYFKMSPDDFQDFIQRALSDEVQIQKHITQDLYYVGIRLGEKMLIVRRAFNIFLGGLILSISIAFICLFYFS